MCIFNCCYLLYFHQVKPMVRTLSHSAVESKADDKSTAIAALMLPSDRAQRQAVPPRLGTGHTGVESSFNFHRINSIDSTRPRHHSATDSDIKLTCSEIDGSRFADSDVVNAAVETLKVQSVVDSPCLHLANDDVTAFDSSRRSRWLSGVSCTSSSTSGGEESPRPGTSAKNINSSSSEWFSSSRPAQHQLQTSTPLNGWLDLTNTPSQRVLKGECDSGLWDSLSGHVDGRGSINSTHSVPVDGISLHWSPKNLNTSVGFSSVLTGDQLQPGTGHIQDNRPLTLESCWNSCASVPEPLSTPASAQHEGLSTLVHSARSSDCQTTNVESADGSLTSLSSNGSFSDVTNHMQSAQNVSPSMPAAVTPSKKRVCETCVLI